MATNVAEAIPLLTEPGFSLNFYFFSAPRRALVAQLLLRGSALNVLALSEFLSSMALMTQVRHVNMFMGQPETSE